MDIELIVLIVLFVFILLLIFLMYIFLKRIVERINKVSKEYYLDKVQVYDNVIQDKEKQLNELNEEIAKKQSEIEENKNNEEIIGVDKNVSSEYEINIKKIDYQDENILQQVKKIDEKFNFDEESLIKYFLSKNAINQDLTKYNELKNYKSKLNSKVCYELSIKKAKEQETFLRDLFVDNQDIINKYMEKNKKMNIITFKSYFDKILLNEDPYIYVYVSDEKKNYNHLSDNIKTIYDSKIYRGIMIKYKNKMYDFCIK